MGVLSNKISKESLKRGDHIYSWRHGYVYSHHGRMIFLISIPVRKCSNWLVCVCSVYWFILFGTASVIVDILQDEMLGWLMCVGVLCHTPSVLVILSCHHRQSSAVLKNVITFNTIVPKNSIFGIYAGEGRVIHFTRGGGQEVGTGTILDRFIFSSSPTNKPGEPCPQCGDHSNADGVIQSCLECFLAGGDLYLFSYGVSPAFFLAKARGGTCTLAKSDPPKDVLYRATHLLENGFGAYNLFKNNCEDFAIYCKTGLLISTNISVGRSGQATAFFAVVSAVVSSPLRYLTTSFGGLTAVGCGMYCVSRLVSDIGVRRDVVKLPVERLVTGSGLDEPEELLQKEE